jgi:SAM-dependent methyltransferase
MVEMAARAVPDADVRVGLLPELPFPDGTFDAVTANFVLNHVGRPKEALVELRRVLRPGGRLALTIWALPHAPGQALLGRAVREGGAVSPPHSAGLAPEDDFTRDDPGLTALLDSAGLRDTRCATLRWNHRVSAEEWWGGPAAGVAAIGTLLCGQTPEVRAAIRRRFDQLSVEFTTEDGLLSLPHAALLARARR